MRALELSQKLIQTCKSHFLESEESLDQAVRVTLSSARHKRCLPFKLERHVTTHPQWPQMVSISEKLHSLLQKHEP